MNDLDAEKNILSGIVQHGKNCLIDITPLIKAEVFFRSENQLIFTALEKTLEHSDKVDYPLLISSINTLGFKELLQEESSFIKELFTISQDIKSVRIQAKKLAKLHIARVGKNKMKAAIARIERVTGEETSTELMSIIEEPGYQIQDMVYSSEENTQLIGQNAVNLVNLLKKTPNREVGILTGFPIYDKAIGGGIRPGGVSLIAARRKMGKSFLAVIIAFYVATKLKLPVLYLDSEMSPEQHQFRLLAHMTGIPIETIEQSKFNSNPSFVKQLDEAAFKLQSIPIFHELIAGKQIDEILAVIRRWCIRNVGFRDNGKIKPCLIIYDYFKLMSSNGLKSMEEYQAIGFQAMELNNLAVILDIPVLSFVQLNKEMDIAQSDRLSWFFTSICKFLDKTKEEIVEDGYDNGNRKMIFEVARFSGGLEKDDYINIMFDGSIGQIKEVGTAFELEEEKKIGKSGFKINDETD